MPKKYKHRKSFTFEGKRYSVWGDSIEELYTKLANKKRDLEEGKTALSGDMVFKDWAYLCIEQYKTNIKDITREGYISKINRWIIPEIGLLKLRSIKPLQCQAIMNSMTGYARDTQKKVNQLLVFIFDKALQNNLVRTNPALNLTIPHGTKSTRRAITDKEREIILQVADTNPKYLYFLFMLFCGCRPSEAIAIEGRDIITVNEQLILHIRGTKTRNADRKVPIPEYLAKRLPKIEPFDTFFKNAEGRPMNRGNRQTLWKHFKRDMNIAMGCEVYRNEVIPPFRVAPDLVPYCLRHTYCTDLCAKGVDIRTAQYLMGHSDISLTANIYTHIDDNMVLTAAKIINN